MIEVRRYSERDFKKVKEFVDHLFNYPAVMNEPPVIRERLIVNFIEKNLPVLSSELKQRGLLADASAEETAEILMCEIYSRVEASSLPVIHSFVDNGDFSFFDSISENGIVDDMHRRIKLHEFIIILFRERDVRYRMYPLIALLKCDAVERYITEIFRRREYIYREITRLEKIKAETVNFINLLKVIILLRYAVYLNPGIEILERPFAGVSYNAEPENSKLQGEIEVFVINISTFLPGIPASVIRLAVLTHFPVAGSGSADPLSRLAYIFCSMFMYYRDTGEPGRGSEPFEKSWLGTARYNCGYAGYDAGMIESLYLIADHNNW